jgi:hypothetical protein
LYRGINEFEKGYQPSTNMATDERGDLLAGPHKSLNRWKNYFCQPLNVHGAGGVRQTEMHTAEPSVPELSDSEVEFAVGKLKRYKSLGADQTPAEVFQAGGEYCVRKFISLLSWSGTKKNCLTNGKSQF